MRQIWPNAAAPWSSYIQTSRENSFKKRRRIWTATFRSLLEFIKELGLILARSRIRLRNCEGSWPVLTLCSPPLMKQIFAYVRVSTAKQGEKGVSLDEQRDAILRYAQRNQFEVVRWFEERQTAAKRGRPVFAEMLRRLRRGEAAGVIIHKIDRSARNLRDWSDLLELTDHGIELHFAYESLDLNSRGGRLSADIQAVVAADYIRNLRDEARKGIYGRLKQGIYPLPAPLGYLDRGKGKPKDPDPAKAPLVRHAFELYATGRFSLDSLVEEVQRLGLKNRRNGLVTRSGISTLLNNPFYVGMIRIRRSGQTFTGAHQPLISRSLFDRVQAILAGRTPDRRNKHQFLFRRLFTCKSCGYALVGERQKGLVYYRCHSKSCPKISFREDSLEEVVRRALTPLQFSPDEVAYFKRRILDLQAGWVEEKKRQIAGAGLALGHLQQRLDRLTDALIDGILEKDLFEGRKAALLSERQRLQERVVDLESGKASLPVEIENFLELAGSAYSSYNSGIPQEKRKLLQTVTSNRIVDGKSVDLTLLPPFDQVANRPQDSNGGPYRDRPRTLDRLAKKVFRHFKAKADEEET